MSSKLVLELRKGLKRAGRSEFKSIADESEVSEHTIKKIAYGAHVNATALNTEKIYAALIRRGHLARKFDFSQCA